MVQVLVYLKDKVLHYQKESLLVADEFLCRELRHHGVAFFRSEHIQNASVVYYGLPDHLGLRKVIGLAVQIQTESFGEIDAHGH